MAFALIRNCILISTNSNFPGTKLQLQYYDKGYEAGREKAQDKNPQIEDPFPNLILERQYKDGYRDGWDETTKANKVR